MSELRIERAGPQMLVVDRGRFGVRDEGLASCGPADALAHDVANVLLGNDAACASIELLLGGATIRFRDRRAFALTGADCGATLDGVPCAPWSARIAHAGSVLELRTPSSGMFTYVAVGDGIDVPLALGSRTTDRLAGIGGYGGRALRHGDRLPLSLQDPRAQALPFAIDPPEMRAVVRVIEGGESEAFDRDSRERLFTQPWRIGHESNRMGYRLQGTPLRSAPGDVASHGVFPGVIQVPPSGEPIVLLADAHATGGYPKAGVAIACDLRLIAQRRPGETLRFQRSSEEEARAARGRRRAYLQALAARAGERWRS